MIKLAQADPRFPSAPYLHGTLAGVSAGDSCAHAGSNEGLDPHEIVDGIGEGEDPADFLPAAMLQFAQATVGLPPAKTFLDQFAFELTHRVPVVPRRPPIDRALGSSRVDILSHVRRRVTRAD